MSLADKLTASAQGSHVTNSRMFRVTCAFFPSFSHHFFKYAIPSDLFLKSPLGLTTI